MRQRRIEPIPVLRLRAAAYRFRESLLLPALIVLGALIAAEVIRP